MAGPRGIGSGEIVGRSPKSRGRRKKKKKTGPTFVDLLRESFLPASERASARIRRKKKRRR